jgi:hypothetical protein
LIIGLAQITPQPPDGCGHGCPFVTNPETMFFIALVSELQGKNSSLGGIFVTRKSWLFFKHGLQFVKFFRILPLNF